MENLFILHLFSQQFEHDAKIVGTRDSLLKLRNALNKLLRNDAGKEEVLGFFVVDGEGFNLKIEKVSNDEALNLPSLPYTETSTVSSDESFDESINNVLASMIGRFQSELFATDEKNLEKYWHFKWNNNASVELNTYEFTEMLEIYNRNCRKWEEHHNGISCVVERVRDKYLMPKIHEFLAALRTSLTDPSVVSSNSIDR